jgi:hypothetical protein
MYPLKYTKCTQDDMDDSNSNYPFASYINGFVDGVKYATDDEEKIEDNIVIVDENPLFSTETLSANDVNTLENLTNVEKIKQVSEGKIEQLSQDKKEQLSQDKKEQLSQDKKEQLSQDKKEQLSQGKNEELFEMKIEQGSLMKKLANKLKSYTQENLQENLQENQQENQQEKLQENFQAPVIKPVPTTIPPTSGGGSNKLFLWLMLFFLIGLLIYIISISSVISPPAIV